MADKLTLTVSNRRGVALNFYALQQGAIEAARNEVREFGETVRALAYFLAAVDTGFMREHIVELYSYNGLAVEVGWLDHDFFAEGKPFYPQWVEPKQPALTVAYDSERPRFERRMRDLMRQAQRARVRGRIGA